MEPNFCYSKKWISIDPWRGYEQPVYAVAGANDTGMERDSPCPAEVCKNELKSVQNRLRAAGIHSKEVVCRSSNVFCIHRYLVCTPDVVEKGRDVVRRYLAENLTYLSYLVEN